MDVTTNNMSNVNTTGHKREIVASRAFSDQMLHRLNDPGLRLFGPIPMGNINPGVFVDNIYTDFQQGTFQATDNPLDLAIAGPGFFVVNLGDEQLFTRDGAFTLAEGMLMTTDGGRVQGVNGDIILPNGYISIDENARIFVNGEYIATIRMTNFSDLTSLRKMQDNFFRTTDLSEEIPFEGQILQGFLEGSNVNIVNEMVQMINNSRAYETNAKILGMIDQTLQLAVNNIASRQ